MEIDIKSMEEILQLSNLEEVYSEGEIFLSAKEGVSFTELCERVDWAVIGVEGGFYDDKVFTPDLSLVEDYSSINFKDWHSYRQNCNLKATQFLKTFDNQKHLRFYLVFVDKHDLNKISRQIAVKRSA